MSKIPKNLWDFLGRTEIRREYFHVVELEAVHQRNSQQFFYACNKPDGMHQSLLRSCSLSEGLIDLARRSAGFLSRDTRMSPRSQRCLPFQCRTGAAPLEMVWSNAKDFASLHLGQRPMHFPWQTGHRPESLRCRTTARYTLWCQCRRTWFWLCLLTVL